MKAMKSINLFDIENHISSILGGKRTMLRKAILKPLLLGMESRLERKSLLPLLCPNSSSFDSHIVGTMSTLCPGVHMLSEKTAYTITTGWVLYFNSGSYSY